MEKGDSSFGMVVPGDDGREMIHAEWQLKNRILLVWKFGIPLEKKSAYCSRGMEFFSRIPFRMSRDTTIFSGAEYYR
jgi:hypothetical protein